MISCDETILNAMKMMDRLRRKLLIVSDNNLFCGLLSIGDIQRALIQNTPFTAKVSSVMRDDYIIASPDQSIDEIRKIMLQIRTEFMPVVDENRKLTNVYFWEDLIDQEAGLPRYKFNLPVVIMAGGLGTRLKPLTNILPKPLVPIGDKTIIEEIFERFALHGSDTFYISTNYKSEFIEYYLNKLKMPYKLHFFKEPKQLGTAGSMSLLKGKITETFFVSNCDILIEQDYSDILEYHKENQNEITIVAAIKTYHIPYGTIETGENGLLTKMEEKPDITFRINSGMYVLEPHLLDEIPENEFFHITDLIDRISGRGGRVGAFPVSENSWKDVGDWNLFLRINEIR